MKVTIVLAAAMSLGLGEAALACTPIAFGKFKVGQRVATAQFAGIPGTCRVPRECVFNERSGAEYVWSSGKVAEVSAPLRIVRGLPALRGTIDAAYARRVNRVACQAFKLKRDDGGNTSLETAERIDPVSRETVRTVIFYDDRATPIVAITSLPEN